MISLEAGSGRKHLMCRFITISLTILVSVFLISCRGPNGPEPPVVEKISDKPLGLRTFPLAAYSISKEELKRLLKFAIDASIEKGALTPDVAVHALRLQAWTSSSMLFDKTELDALAEKTDLLLRALIDTPYYCTNSGKNPLMVSTANGVAYRTVPQTENALFVSQMMGGLSHVDAVLAAFAETDFDLSSQLIMHDGKKVPARQLLSDSLARDPSKREIEWSAIAYCRYLEDDTWPDSNGKPQSIDQLASILLSISEGVGACDGTHVVYAIATCAYRGQLKSSEYGKRCTDYLKNLSTKLEDAQALDGSWGANWHKNADPEKNLGGRKSKKNARQERFRVTAHMLEWFAIVPPDTRPSDEVIRKAMEFVSSELRLRPLEYFNEMLLPTTHAVRALVNLSIDGEEVQAQNKSSQNDE